VVTDVRKNSRQGLVIMRGDVDLVHQTYTSLFNLFIIR
jgi:hypothetical protein